MSFFLPGLYSFIGCTGYCLLVNMRGKLLFFAPFGSFLCWLIYTLSGKFTGSDIFQCFLATIAVSIYSEVMARTFKAPTTCFQIVAILPLVPGGGIYYTMNYCLNGDIPAFIETGLHTFAVAGSIALGILFVSSFVQLIRKIRKLPKLKSF